MRSQSIAATCLAVLASVAAAGCGGSEATTDTTTTEPSLTDTKASAPFQRCAVVGVAESQASGLREDEALENIATICGTMDDPTPLGQSVPDERVSAACSYLRDQQYEPSDGANVGTFLNGVCP